jgi:hypothetical protein
MRHPGRHLHRPGAIWHDPGFWSRANLRRIQWAIWSIWAALLVCVLIWGRPGVFVGSLIVSTVGVLIAIPLSFWWLRRPTLSRAIAALLVATLVVCGSSAGLLVLRYYDWMGPPLIPK